jgi:hypothetical protein
MLNLANPSLAFEASFLPNDGIGLARMEFIASNHVKAHPLALLHPEKASKADQKAIRKLTEGFASPRDYFVSKLAGGIGTLAAAFYPKPVILRFSCVRRRFSLELGSLAVVVVFVLPVCSRQMASVAVRRGIACAHGVRAAPEKTTPNADDAVDPTTRGRTLCLPRWAGYTHAGTSRPTSTRTCSAAPISSPRRRTP